MKTIPDLSVLTHGVPALTRMCPHHPADQLRIKKDMVNYLCFDTRCCITFNTITLSLSFSTSLYGSLFPSTNDIQTKQTGYISLHDDSANCALLGGGQPCYQADACGSGPRGDGAELQ